MDIIALFIFGTMMGSFFGVIIYRLHAKEKGIFSGRSHCDNCGYTLQSLDLIPILSWTFLGGKCRKCKMKISIEHPTFELLTGILYATVGFLVPFAENPLLLLWYIFLISSLWIITTYDLKYMEIPDEVSLPTIGILIICAFFGGENIPYITDALLGALVPLSFFLVQFGIGALLKKDLVGGGDLRLGAIMGLALGWKITIFMLFLSYILGAIFLPLLILLKKKTKENEVPFGPFLALATFIGLFWGNEIANLWLDFTGLSSIY